MRTPVFRVWIAGMAMVAVSSMAEGQAQPRSYAWVGQLVSFDAASKTATIAAQTFEHVAKQVARVKPGEPIAVTWSIFKGQGDLVIYAPPADEMKAIDAGFLLPAELVSADAAANTLTFKRKVPDALVSAFQALAPGTWIKVTMPVDQVHTAALTAVVAAAKPEPRPKVVVVDPAVQLKQAEGAALASVTGQWALSMSLGGMDISSNCKFTQSDKALTGDCTLGPASSPIGGGQVAGRVVRFSQKASLGGMEITFDFQGIVDEANQTMSGTVSFFGMTAGFTGKKS